MNHQRAVQQLQREFPGWPGGDLEDLVQSTKPRLTREEKEVVDRYHELRGWDKGRRPGEAELGGDRLRQLLRDRRSSEECEMGRYQKQRSRRSTRWKPRSTTTSKVVTSKTERSTMNKKGWMAEGQRAVDALNAAEVRGKQVIQYIKDEITQTREQINRVPRAMGDEKFYEASSAYIRAMTLQDTLGPMEQEVANGQKLLQQRLRTRRLSSTAMRDQLMRDQLIKLGAKKPELQKHIRPVLDALRPRCTTS